MLGADAPDSALAQAAAQGDADAFAALVRRHKHALYRLLLRYTGDADEAYDGVQDAFIAAWRALQRYDPQKPFGSWLRTIALNKGRDQSRRQTVRRLIFGAGESESSEALNAAAPGPDAETSAILDEQSRVLNREIRRLPTALKEALILTYFEGLSQSEAAETLGVSVKTVETRVYRARKLLAQRLQSSDLRTIARGS